MIPRVGYVGGSAMGRIPIEGQRNRSACHGGRIRRLISGANSCLRRPRRTLPTRSLDLYNLARSILVPRFVALHPIELFAYPLGPRFNSACPRTRSSPREDAAKYIRELPKAEQEVDEWQTAIEAMHLVVDNNGPTMMARIGVMRR
jgi:hypothetical protein